jgi:hypothetical protein
MAEAQKTATLRIMETRISSAAEQHVKKKRNKADPGIVPGDRPEGTGRTGFVATVHLRSETNE